MESSARNNVSVENRLGYTRSASMDSAGPPLAARSGSMLSRRSSRQASRGSISLSREMGDSILNSMRHSLQSADELFGDVDSSVLAQLIESGRVLAPDGYVDEDTANTSEHHKVGPLPDDAEVQNNGKSAAKPISLVETKVAISSIPADSCTKVEPYKLSLRLDYAAYMIHLAVFGFLGIEGSGKNSITACDEDITDMHMIMAMLYIHQPKFTWIKRNFALTKDACMINEVDWGPHQEGMRLSRG